MLEPILERLPQIDAVRCYFEPDGSFPNHEPNPLLPENREFIIARSRRRRRPGIAFDGDADRCFFVDESGEFAPEISSPRSSPRLPGQGTGRQDHLRRPRQLGRPHTIEQAGGTALMNRVGHAFIKHRMRETALSSARGLGSLLLPRLFQGRLGDHPRAADAGVRLEAGKPLSEILRPYREHYFITGEITLASRTWPPSCRARAALLGQGKVTHLDGLSVDADDWHFNVRPSNTEPLLRLNLEALSPDLMEKSATRCSRYRE